MKRTRSNDKQINHIRALVHGDSGVGKTTSILTLPDDITVVALAERGAVPLRKKAYTVDVIETWDDCRELVTQYRKPQKTESGKDARILVLDSLSAISELCKRQIVAVERKKLISSRTGGKEDTPKGIYDDLMAQEDWGLYISRMSGLIGSMCHLPMHVIMLSLSNHAENKKTGETVLAPDLSGKLAYRCPAYFDLVFYMHVGEVIEGDTKRARLWRTENNGEVLAKDASGELEPIIPADWSAVFTKIIGNEKAKGEVKA